MGDSLLMGGYEYAPRRSLDRFSFQIYGGKKQGRQEGYSHRKKKEEISKKGTWRKRGGWKT